MHNKDYIKKASLIISIIFIFGLFITIKSIITVSATSNFNEYTEVSNSPIKAELKSSSYLSMQPEESTTLKYSITPESINTKIDDIVFLLDFSTNMKDDGSQTEDGMGSRDALVDNLISSIPNGYIQNVNMNIDPNLNIGILGFNESVYKLANNSESKFFATRSTLEKDYKIGDIKKNINDYNYSPSNGKYCDRNIIPALEEADVQLEKINSNGGKRNQAITIITSGAYTDNLQNSETIEKMKKIKDKGYKIITIDLSNDIRNNTPANGKFSNSDSDDTKSIRAFQDKISRDPAKKSYDYLVGNYDWNNKNYATDGEKTYGDITKQLFQKLLLGTAVSGSQCSFDNVSMNFGVNDKYSLSENAIVDFGSIDNVPEGLKIKSDSSGKVTIPIITENYIATIDLDKCISYTKNENTSTFTAKPFTVSFDITLKTDNDSLNLKFGQNNTADLISNLIYKKNIDGNESNELLQLESPEIGINSYTAKVQALLKNPIPPTQTKNINDINNIDVKYGFTVETYKANTKLNSNQFNTTVYSRGIDELVFLMDVTKNAKLQSDYYHHAVVNQILGNISKSKVAFVGMNSDAECLRGDTEEDMERNINQDRSNQGLSPLDLDNINLLSLQVNRISEVADKRLLKADSLRNSSSLQQPNVGAGLAKADNILQTEGEKNKTKAIVLMVSNSFQLEESDKQIIQNIKNRGYQIIILDNSYKNEKDNNEAEDKLKELISEFGNSGTDYIAGKHDTMDAAKNYNYADDDGKEIYKSIQLGYNRQFVLKNIKLNFDLGECFSHVSGLQSENSLGDNRYSVTVGDVVFKGKIINSNNNILNVTYTLEDKPQDIDFYVKLNKYNSNGKAIFGTEDTVKENNYISYKNFKNELEKNNIDTPIILNENPVSIHHGLYIGGSPINDSVIKSIGDNQKFAKNSMLTLGGYIKNISGKNNNIELYVNKNLVINGDIQVFKVNKDGCSNIGNMLFAEENTENIKYNIHTDLGNDDKILIRYVVKLPDKKGLFINNIKVSSGESASANINVQEELPDLF